MAGMLRVVEWAVDADRREEILGDLLELSRARSRPRLWWDVVSICVRAPKAQGWGSAGLTAGLIALLTFGGRPPHRTVVARDPAGTFALEFEGSRVVAATMDGAPVSRDRIQQTDGRLVIRGAARNRDLDIELHQDGSFRWQGRSPQ